jgi:putative transposase
VENLAHSASFHSGVDTAPSKLGIKQFGELIVPAPLSTDLRERIVASVEGGSSRRAAAQRFLVAPSSAVRLLQRVKRTGSITPGKVGGHRRPILEPHEAKLRGMVDAQPDITLGEIKAKLQALGVVVGLTAIHTALHRLGLRFKKRR